MSRVQVIKCSIHCNVSATADSDCFISITEELARREDNTIDNVETSYVDETYRWVRCKINSQEDAMCSRTRR